MTVESERKMDNKDTAEVELTGCQGREREETGWLPVLCFGY